MQYRFSRHVFAGVFSLLITGTSYAAEHDAGASQYQQGTTAFRAGDYQQALQHFQAARDQGRESPALIYNTGVTHYKLRQLNDAERSFRELLGRYPEWTDIARYNLGLVALRRGDDSEAERWFTTVYQSSDNEKLVYLASVGLSELDITVDVPARPTSKRWFTLLSLGGGYDDNAIAFPDQLQTSAAQGGDSYLELLAYGQAYLSGNAGDGLRLQGFAFTKQYNDLDVVDVTTFNAGLSRDFRYEDWRGEYGLGAGYTEVDGDQLTTQIQGKVQLGRSLGQHRYTFTYQPVYHNAGSNYQQLGGWQHRVDLRWRHHQDNGRWTLRYRLDYNDRDDLMTENTFLSYSPLRNSILLDIDWYASSALTLSVGGEYKNSRYAGENRMTDIDGVFKEQKRKSDRIDAWVKGQYELTPSWRILAEYRYSDNDDTFELYQYKRNEIKAAIEFTY